MNAACSYAELGIPLFPGIPLTVLDDVPVATVDPLPIPPTLPPDPPECVTRYAQYLKDKYKRMSTLPDGDWPPSLGRQYTRLAMIEQERELPGAELVATMERDYIHGNVDNIVKKKKAIQLPEMFLPTEDGGQQLKILMDGAPGVGKSTLSRKVCKDWASGQLLQQYHLVLLLPLRQASIREANSIEDLIKSDSPDLQQQVVQHIQETSGEHILLILDGYDELSNEDRTQGSLFLDIVRGDKFPRCSVLVTSRPYASDYLQQLESVNRHVEVLGFTEEQIEHCIMENIPDKAKATELVQSLKERQDIASVCYIPLNCAIVLHVYKMAHCTLPHSLTKLYEAFIVNALKRHAKITGNDPRSTRRLNTLKNLPEPLQQQLNAVSMLAYNGLVADKMVFSTGDLEAIFPDCSDLNIDCNLLGLMTTFKEFTSTDEELSYQFLHLTIQEFLGARWAASHLSGGKFLKFFQDNLREERYRMMLLFLAGISQLNFHSSEYIFHDKLNFENPISRFARVNYFLFLAHLIFESQNFSLFQDLATTLQGAVLSAAWYSMSPFDCLVLAYFLAWCDCSLNLLDLTGCGLTNQSLEIIHRVNLEHCGTIQIEEVNLGYNPKVTTKLSLLSKVPMFEHTRVLKACGLQHPKHCQVSYDLVDLLNMRHLTTLEISVQKNPDSYSLIYLSLNEFRCQHGNIHHQNAVHIFRSLEHNTSLGELDLSGNSQLAEGDSEAVGCAIAKMLKINKTLKVLCLTNCGLDTVVATHIFKSLEHNTSLEELDLSGNSQLAEGDSEAVGCAIAKMLKINKTLKVLCLTNCGLDNVVATHIFKSLEHNTSLEELDLSWNRQLAEGDSEAVGCAIERILNVNRTLAVLNLSGCNITDPVAKHILTGLTKNTSLVTLNMGSPTLSVSCAVSLFKQMTTHHTLSRVHVGAVNILGVGSVKMDRESLWCVIGDLIPENCVEFFRALNNSCLKVSKLNVQALTGQTAEHFAVGLAEYRSFQALKLQHCNITSTGAVSIFRSLEHNTSLEELDLSWNSQLAEGDSEAVGCAIAKILKINKTFKVLCLTNCGLDTVVATHIFKSLEHNTSLEELDLSGNSQLAEDDSEAVGCAIERILNVNRTLAVLNLSGCNITDPVAKHILTGLTKNTSLVTLNMGSPTLSGSCAVSLFKQVTTHHTLSREHIGVVNILGVGRVKMDRESLWCVIGDLIPENCVEFFRALNNSGLKVSKLNVQDLTDQTAEHFAVGLAEYRSFQALKLQHCNITSTDAVSIFRSLEHNTILEELDLSWNSQLAEGDSGAVGCAIAKMLQINKTFKVLCLTNCGLDNVVATHIFKSLEHNTSLEELDLSWNRQLAEGDSEAVGCAIERILNVNRTLAVLNLSGCNITDPVAKHILTGLTKNTSLVTLNMGSPTLSVSCAVSLFQQMTTHPSLSITVGEVNVLGVGRIKMDRESLWCVIGDLIPEDCVEFFSALNNSGLKVSNLNVENLTDQTAEHFAVGLAEYRSFQALKLKHCNISSTGAVSIFRSLEHNTSLEILDLSGNWQLAEGDSAALGCAIERMLNVYRTLEVLNLYGCRMANEVASYFANGLAQNHSVRKVILHSNNIGSASAVSIFRSLEHNTSLEELDLSGNSQLAEGDSEAVGCAIERMLNANRHLKILNLWGCRVTDPVAKHVVTGLTKNTSLVTLAIGSSSKLSGKCAVSLLYQVTTHLTLRTVGEMNVLGVGRIGMDNGTIWCVMGHTSPEHCVEFFRALNNSGLMVSKLNVQDLTAQTAEHFAVGLAESQSVQALKLKHCNITSAGAVSIFRSLEHNTSLKELDLSGNWQIAEGDSEAVGCAIERMLNVNRHLKILNLWGCRVTDPAAKHVVTGLTKNTSLVTIGIGSSSKLSGKCAVSLLHQVTTHPTLRTVGEMNVLGVGRIGMDNGTIWCVMGHTSPEHCVEFFRALNNSGLMVSKLNVQDLTAQTAEHFAVGLAESQSVQALKLKHCNITSACAVSIFRSLEHNTSLKELDLSENSQLGEGDSEAVGCAIERMLKVNRTMEILNFNLTNEVASYFANGLAPNHSVRKVILHSNNIGSTGAVSIFKSLEHNTSLEELDLSGNSQLAEGDSEAVGCVIERMLNANRHLKILNLWGCRVTDPVAKHVVTGLTKNTSLVTLAIGSSFKLSSKCAVSLLHQVTTHPTLSTVGEMNVLGVGRIGMDNGTIWCVMGHTGPEHCVEFFRALNNSGLMVSKLNVQDLTAQTAEHFVVGLVESQSVQALKLKHCNITSTGAVSIFRSLEHNTSLEELNLSGNRQLAEGDSEAVGCAIERMLNANRHLKILNLNDCKLETTVITHTAAGLAHNASLVQLNIGWNSFNIGIFNQNNITSEGWVHLFKALCNNTSLKKLDISGNKPVMEGSVALAEMLSCNKSLTELNLRLCDIPEAGLREVARGLLHNTTLKKLDISHNKLGIEGSVALAEMLSCNKSLTELNLGLCDLPEAGLREIARGLLQNTSLQTLNLWPLPQKTFLEAEMERLKKSGNFTSQSSSRLEIKIKWH